MPPSSWTTGSRASYRRWLCAGRPRWLPTRGCWCSTSGWPPTSAWTRHWLRSPDGLRFLVGTLVPDGATPVAQAYAGHQFGGFVPRLGDGRALLLGEIATADGTVRDLHLKGSGATPFARGGDGLAAVGPMLREYIVSEAMHALGIPTTRSLAVVAHGAPGPSRDAAAGSRAREGGEQPSAGGQLSIRRDRRRRRIGAAPRRPRHRPAPPRRPPRRTTRTARCSRRWSPPRRRWWRNGCSSGSCTG